MFFTFLSSASHLFVSLAFLILEGSFDVELLAFIFAAAVLEFSSEADLRPRLTPFAGAADLV